MADESATTGTEEVEFRPCPFCGTSIHPSSHRCPECCGHVGIAWGTVHKELFLFLLSAVLIGAACLVSWRGRSPDGPIGPEIGAFDTIRGTFMFAIALYGLTAGLMNIFYRRMVVWPFLVNALVALWVGLPGLIGAFGSPAWEAWRKANKGGSMFESYLGGLRAIPPADFLLVLAGGLVLIKLVGGVLAAATSGKGKAAARPETTSRRRRAEAGGAAPMGETPAGAESIPPAPETEGGPGGSAPSV